MRRQDNASQTIVFGAIICMVMLGVSGCSSTYYSAMEKVGKHKRDIMIDRVENARDAQAAAQEQFKSALERFDAVVKLKETDLKKTFDSLNKEYEKSEQSAQQVSARIAKIETVAEDLFDEWEAELAEYQSKELRQSSKDQLKKTKQRYQEMLVGMQQAEKSMQPVLKIFKDNVLFLKHNLNAQAIGSLQSEFTHLKGEIDSLVKKMNTAIELSNKFLADVKQ
jgi:Protein of unknown function (DUF2959)